MTINNVRMLASRRRITQLVLAERSQTDSAIAVRAIRRLFPDREVRPVTNLAEADTALACTRLATALVASGLDGRTFEQTIRWFVRKGCGVVVALLENCDDRHRQEALEAGASCVWSKPELLVAQLHYELAARLRCAEPERPRLLGQGSRAAVPLALAIKGEPDSRELLLGWCRRFDRRPLHQCRLAGES